jgi:PST family polysaccharide transporter
MLLHYLKDNYHYFVSRIANNGSRYLVTTFNGAYFGNTIVGYYALAEKLFYAIATIGGVISQTIFPYMSRTRDLRLISKMIWTTLAFAIPVSSVLMYFNEYFLELVFDVKGKVVSTIFLLVFSGSVSFSLVVCTISGLLFRIYYINKTGLLNINPIKKEN